jgi:hypothetical protein
MTATSQYIPLEERAAIGAAALLSLESTDVELFLCPNCGDAGGEPREFYDAGDAAVGYAGGYEPGCSRCVKGSRS